MKVKNYKAGKVGSVELDSAPFGEKVLWRTLKDAMDMYAANERQGTVKTKGRSEVAYSRKKLWKQKHTGRARSGDRKNPVWRGGGTIFGPLPRDWSYHMPIKARRVALKSAVLGKLKDEEVVLFEVPKLDKPSSKTVRKVIDDLGTPRRVLFVLLARNEAFWKSARNFPGVQVRTADEVCAIDVLRATIVVSEKEALDSLATRLAKTTKAGVA
ncbi:MAG: 50S ribosomal protein L4 [Planctomycetes bacterium]|nr:50S ribosomal protein L4 [Planctomycetota bacterium]